MKKLKEWLTSLDYRHYICACIVLGSLMCSVFVFTTAPHRLVESFRDVGTSVVYYFNFLFDSPGKVDATVTDFSSLPLQLPFGLPSTWEEFTLKWDAYWKLIVTAENVSAYINAFNNFLISASYVLLYAMPIVTIVMLLYGLVSGETNNDYNKDSKCLVWWKKFCARVYAPAKAWLSDFVCFVRERDIYVKIVVGIWAYNFNVATIVVEAVAYYFYFAASFDLVSLYRQVLKLLVDLFVPIDFLPWFLWVVIGLIVLDVVRRKIGYSRLEHFERKNRGFINERPILMLVCGTMGKKKTTMITDMALSQEIMFRDKAFEKLLQADLKFPYFPWINFENTFKTVIARHKVYNLATCRKYVAFFKACFVASLDGGKAVQNSCRRQLKKRYGYAFDDLLWEYDYNRYGYEYNDGLQVVDVWKVLSDYAQLYFIYVMTSSLIVSNYSIRTDNVLDDIGNFPLWNTELFRRDARLMQAYSRHSHILDFDMLRLGKKIVEDNMYANTFEFGVVLVTEIGKERGNMLELKDKKKNDDEANQKNDLFNSWLKMCRHSATVDNFPFVRIISDEQRPSSWGADAVELCEIVYIKESGETNLAMPFFTLSGLVFDWEVDKFKSKYADYRYRRGDNSLAMYLFKGLSARINDYKTRIYNTFGYNKMQVQMEDGTRDGNLLDKNYYLMFKKIYSRRFATDCYSDFYMQKALKSMTGLEDLPEYATVRATVEEFLRQNSYFMADLLIGLLGQTKS